MLNKPKPNNLNYQIKIPSSIPPKLIQKQINSNLNLNLAQLTLVTFIKSNNICRKNKNFKFRMLLNLNKWNKKKLLKRQFNLEKVIILKEPMKSIHKIVSVPKIMKAMKIWERTQNLKYWLNTSRKIIKTLTQS